MLNEKEATLENCTVCAYRKVVACVVMLLNRRSDVRTVYVSAVPSLDMSDNDEAVIDG